MVVVASMTKNAYICLIAGYNEQALHNQVHIAMITYCLMVLTYLDTKSRRTFLQINRYLKATLWNLLTFDLENPRKERSIRFYLSLFVLGYSKKTNVCCLCLRVLVLFF